MTETPIPELRALLGTARVLSLSVIVDGDPYLGLLPFAMAPGGGAALVHASGLARHTRGLTPGARFAALVHKPDRPDADPLQIARVSFQGAVEVLPKGSGEYDEARRAYLGRFPSSEQTFLLGDFNLYRLRFQKGRYVGGFARARSLGRKDLEQLG